ncbi:MAG: hypothetical protein AABY22_17275 [Nanoarchaeota archaeon]
MAWDEIGFTVNLIRSDLLPAEGTVLDPLAFEQLAPEFSGGKLTGIIQSKSGKIIIDLENDQIKIRDGTIDKIILGDLKNGTTGLSIDSKDTFKILDAIPLFVKDFQIITQYTKDSFGGISIITPNNFSIIPRTRLNFSVDVKSNLIVLFSAEPDFIDVSASTNSRASIRFQVDQAVSESYQARFDTGATAGDIDRSEYLLNLHYFTTVDIGNHTIFLQGQSDSGFDLLFYNYRITIILFPTST